MFPRLAVSPLTGIQNCRNSHRTLQQRRAIMKSSRSCGLSAQYVHDLKVCFASDSAAAAARSDVWRNICSSADVTGSVVGQYIRYRQSAVICRSWFHDARINELWRCSLARSFDQWKLHFSTSTNRSSFTRITRDNNKLSIRASAAARLLLMVVLGSAVVRRALISRLSRCEWTAARRDCSW